MKCSLFCLEVKAGALGHLVEHFRTLAYAGYFLGSTVRPTKRANFTPGNPFGQYSVVQGSVLLVDNNPKWLRVKSDNQGWKFSAPAEGSAIGDRKTRSYGELRLGPAKGLTPGISQGPCAVAPTCWYRAKCSLWARGVSTPSPAHCLPTKLRAGGEKGPEAHCRDRNL